MRSRWHRPRGIRARLVITYSVAAVLAAFVGMLVFIGALSVALRNNLDGDLRATAGAFAADVRAGTIQRAETSPRLEPGRPHHEISAIVAIYDPSGRLVVAEPSALPAAPHVAQAGGITTRFAGRTFRLYREDVRTDAGTWQIVVGQTQAGASDASADARHLLYVIVPVALVLSALGAWLLSGAALRPVERMRADAARLAATETSGPSGTPGRPGAIRVPETGDELARLARTLNTLLDRLHTSLERQQALVADAGHELRTPLAVLQTELETAVRPGRSRADLVESIEHARQEAARLITLSDDLLLLAQADGRARLIRPVLVDVSALIDQTVAAHRDGLARHGVAVEVDVDEIAPAPADPVALRRILDNLLGNAARYTPPGGTVRVTARDDSDGVTLRVQDTGPGFPDDFLPHAFERFARADRARSRSSAAGGSGLGLSIVATLVTAHGGTVHAANGPTGGAAVHVTLPR